MGNSCIKSKDKSKDEEDYKFREKLKSEGHTCIKISKSYPSQTSWCQQKKCTNQSKHRQI